MARILIKKLRDSDLTVFHWHFHNQPMWRRPGTGESRQKAINLDKHTFVRELYPALATPAGWGGSGKPNYGVAMRIWGPGSAPVMTHSKTISLEQKNWRLNGLIENPASDPKRFDALRDGDLALMSFGGVGGPANVDIYFLAAASAIDAPLVATLAPSNSSLIAVDSALAATVAGVAPTHPLLTYLTGSTMAGATGRSASGPTRISASPVGGGPAGPPGGGPSLVAPLTGGASSAIPFEDLPSDAYLDRSPGDGRTTATDYARAQRRQIKVGELGETLVDAHLSERQEAEGLTYEWHSRDRPDAPFDFRLGDGRLEVKTTTGDHGSLFDISTPELLKVLEDGEHALYRVSDLDEDAATGVLRICHDPRNVIEKVVHALKTLPNGIRVPSVRLDPRLFAWDSPIVISLDLSEDEEST